MRYRKIPPGPCTHWTAQTFDSLTSLKQLEKLSLECGSLMPSDHLSPTVAVLPRIGELNLVKFSVTRFLMDVAVTRRLRSLTVHTWTGSVFHHIYNFSLASRFGPISRRHTAPPRGRTWWTGCPSRSSWSTLGSASPVPLYRWSRSPRLGTKPATLARKRPII